MRKPIIAANWKMNKSNKEAVSFIKEFKKLVKGVKDIEIVICVPFTALTDLNSEIKNSNIGLGAQNMFYEDKGAFTGEISALMIKDLCKYVIIGHSERRQYFNETDDDVNKKIKKALENRLIPIVCVGETLEQHEINETEHIIDRQLKNALKGITKNNDIVVAYEPVWAIGTGRTASPEQAQEVHSFIRKLLGEIFDKTTASKIRIIYGGSANPNNIKGLMQQEDIDGALVGGASLEVKSFCEVVKFK